VQNRSKSREREADLYCRFRESWQLYARWGAMLRRQADNQTAAVDHDRRYAAIERIVKAFEELGGTEKIHLAELLETSDRLLAPLADPFRLPFSGNRWLDPRREREESYSDWLAWLLGRMDSAEQVLRVFGIDNTEFGLPLCKRKPTISREESFRTPGGEPKRLDVVIRFGDAGILLVEVKIRDIDAAGGAENLPAYLGWLEKHQPDAKRRYAILLVPNPMERPPGWDVRTWDEVSLKLRLRAAVCDSSTSVSNLFAAMLLCFAGAVEQNILGLDVNGATIKAPQTALFLEHFLHMRGWS
jgi:hypothetical protein